MSDTPQSVDDDGVHDGGLKPAHSTESSSSRRKTPAKRPRRSYKYQDDGDDNDQDEDSDGVPEVFVVEGQTFNRLTPEQLHELDDLQKEEYLYYYEEYRQEQADMRRARREGERASGAEGARRSKFDDDDDEEEESEFDEDEDNSDYDDDDYDDDDGFDQDAADEDDEGEDAAKETTPSKKKKKKTSKRDKDKDKDKKKRKKEKKEKRRKEKKRKREEKKRRKREEKKLRAHQDVALHDVSDIDDDFDDDGFDEYIPTTKRSKSKSDRIKKALNLDRFGADDDDGFATYGYDDDHDDDYTSSSRRSKAASYDDDDYDDDELSRKRAKSKQSKSKKSKQLYSHGEDEYDDDFDGESLHRPSADATDKLKVAEAVSTFITPSSDDYFPDTILYYNDDATPVYHGSKYTPEGGIDAHKLTNSRNRITYSEFKELQLRRNLVEKSITRPYFPLFVIGLYVQIVINGRNCCGRVIDVVFQPEKSYTFKVYSTASNQPQNIPSSFAATSSSRVEEVTTDLYFVIDDGRGTRNVIPVNHISNKTITEDMFAEYCSILDPYLVWTSGVNKWLSTTDQGKAYIRRIQRNAKYQDKINGFMQQHDRLQSQNLTGDASQFADLNQKIDDLEKELDPIRSDETVTIPFIGGTERVFPLQKIPTQVTPLSILLIPTAVEKSKFLRQRYNLRNYQFLPEFEKDIYGTFIHEFKTKRGHIVKKPVAQLIEDAKSYLIDLKQGNLTNLQKQQALSYPSREAYIQAELTQTFNHIRHLRIEQRKLEAEIDSKTRRADKLSSTILEVNRRARNFNRLRGGLGGASGIDASYTPSIVDLFYHATPQNAYGQAILQNDGENGTKRQRLSSNVSSVFHCGDKLQSICQNIPCKLNTITNSITQLEKHITQQLNGTKSTAKRSVQPTNLSLLSLYGSISSDISPIEPIKQATQALETLDGHYDGSYSHTHRFTTSEWPDTIPIPNTIVVDAKQATKAHDTTTGQHENEMGDIDIDIEYPSVSVRDWAVSFAGPDALNYLQHRASLSIAQSYTATDGQ